MAGEPTVCSEVDSSDTCNPGVKLTDEAKAKSAISGSVSKDSLFGPDFGVVAHPVDDDDDDDSGPVEDE